MIKTGAMIGAGLLTGGRAGAKPSERYEMPLESEPHSRTFMQWQVSLAPYGKRDLARAQAAIIRIANAIAEHLPLAMLAATDAKRVTRL